MTSIYNVKSNHFSPTMGDNYQDNSAVVVASAISNTPEGTTTVTVTSGGSKGSKRKGKDDKTNVRINTVDTDYKFSIHSVTTGRQLFDQVVHLLQVKSVWFFGLQYTDTKGYPTWLKLKKKVFSQEMGRKRPVQLQFRAKFYPEDVGKELTDLPTLKQFYLQTKDDILTERLYSPVDTAVLLASFVVQAKYGDYLPTIHTPGFLDNEVMLPKKVLEQYDLTNQQWEDRIVSFYRDQKGLDQETCMMEYMKVAQDLEMFGINYFTIKNKKGTELLLGVDSLGLNVYEKSNKLTPKLGFPWSEIKSISFSDKKFTIKPVDDKAPHFIFFAHRVRINKRILALCMGNHELYVRRRREARMQEGTQTEGATVTMTTTSATSMGEAMEEGGSQSALYTPTSPPTIITTAPTPTTSPPTSPTDDIPQTPATPQPPQPPAATEVTQPPAAAYDSHTHENGDHGDRSRHNSEAFEASEPAGRESFEEQTQSIVQCDEALDDPPGGDDSLTETVMVTSNNTPMSAEPEAGPVAEPDDVEEDAILNGKGVHFGSTTDMALDQPIVPGTDLYPTTILPPPAPSPAVPSNFSDTPYIPSSSVPKGTYVCNVMVGEEIDDRKYEMKVTEGEEEEEDSKEFSADLHWEMSKSDEVKQREKEYEERDLHTKKNKNTYRKLVRLFEDLNQDAIAAGPGSPEDELMREIREEGMDKYKTLRGIRRGNTKDRVAVFEAL